MTPGTRIIIDNGFISNGENKKYRSDEAELQQNQREKEVQRARDERAREQAANGNGNNAQNPG